MKQTSQFQDRHAESRLYSRRLFVAALVILLLAVGLLTRMIWLQWVQHDHFRALSNQNRIQTQPIAPPRGLILDRYGRILANNKPDISISVVPEHLDDLATTLEHIKQLINLDDNDIAGFNRRLAGPRHPFDPVLLRNRLTDIEAAKIAASSYQLTGVHLEADAIRHYPYDDLLAHSVGYVSRISAKDLQAMTPEELENYQGTHAYGHAGTERYYENLLHGKVGFRKVEVNARGRVLRVLSETPPEQGENLQLYLDIDVQKTAWNALGEKSGAIVAIDPRSGGILSLVSKPGFNPNLFVTGISYKDYNGYQENTARPLFNRALQGQYPPGSTIKPFMGLAGLAYHATDWSKTIYDPGHFKLPNNSRVYRDWKRSGHGYVNLAKAIQVSCDVYFYQLGVELGMERIHEFLSQFSFGKPTGIDLYGESKGILPNNEWKRAYRKAPWFPGDTVNASIGQGYMLATPLQLATAAAIFSRNGQPVKPRLADIKGKEQPPIGDSGLLDNPADWQRMLDAMVSVTNQAQGTAGYIGRNAKYTIAGKTGTAQVFSLDGAEYNAHLLPQNLRDHSLFIGFAPAKDPAIVIAVLIENKDEGGATAATVARQVMDAWLLNDEGELHIPRAEPTSIRPSQIQVEETASES